jgi:LPS-assembly lipoprotein
MTLTFSRISHFVAAMLAVLTLASCGFHLRGPQPLAFSSLHVGMNPYSDLGVALRRQVALSGTTAVEEDESRADARLQILANERRREILSLTAAGKVREYELEQRIRFRLLDKTGEELISPTDLIVRREYTFNDELILGKEQEEALLLRDMEADLVHQLMRRLSAWQRP